MAIMVIKVTITFLSNSSDDDDSRSFVGHLRRSSTPGLDY